MPDHNIADGPIPTTTNGGIPPTVRNLKVLAVTYTIGTGETKDDPIRPVTALYGEDMTHLGTIEGDLRGQKSIDEKCARVFRADGDLQGPASPEPFIGYWLAVEKERNHPCWCYTCRPLTATDMRFVVCPDCGNKRCPKANHHDMLCSGSNDPGQPGSAHP